MGYIGKILERKIEAALKTAVENPLIGPEGAQQLIMNSAEFIAASSKLRWLAEEVIHQVYDTISPKLGLDVFGERYQSPLGLGPGIIKEPFALDLFSELPFGFIVLGGVTGKSQPGNPQPRIWRNDKQGNIFNVMGLPGTGVESVVNKLKYLEGHGRGLNLPLWVNLCNSLSTTQEDEKVMEFQYMLEKLYPHVDVIELNFSCPNQAGVTGMQKSQKLLKDIIKGVQEKNEEMAIKLGIHKKPILVKIGPLQPDSENPLENDDLSNQEIRMIVETCSDLGVHGIVATNTAKNHTGVDGSPGKGGLSGLALHERSLRTVQAIRSINTEILIVGAGGVGTGETPTQVKNTATGLLNAGANLEYMVSAFTQSPISAVNQVNLALTESKET